MSRSTIDVHTVLMTAGAAVAATMLAWGGLWTIARPLRTSARLAEIDRQAGEIRIAQAALHGSSAQAGVSVCEGAADSVVSTLRQTLSMQISQDGTGGVNLAASPQTTDEANGGLQRVNLTIEATARYPMLMRMLQGLTRSGPTLFVDSLDMKPANGSVSLKLSGRFYCSPVHL